MWIENKRLLSDVLFSPKPAKLVRAEVGLKNEGGWGEIINWSRSKLVIIGNSQVTNFANT